MKKKVCILVYGITTMFFVFFMLNKAGSLNDLYNNIGVNVNDEINKEIVTTFGENNKAPFIVYYPNSKGTLDVETLDVKLNANLYKNIIRTLIAYKSEYFQGDYNVTSIQKKDSLIRLNFSSSFKSDLCIDEEKFRLIIMSFVNTLSEIKGVEFVEVYSGKEKISLNGVSKFEKNLNIINLKLFNSPDEVLKEQMKLEQNGEYLKAYMLMSYKQTSNRKMYHEYFKEMQEIEEIGFLDGEFKVIDTNINKDEAIVNVQFDNVSITGDPLNSSTVPIKCIKVKGNWFVNW